MIDNDDRAEFIQEKEQIYGEKVHFLEFARLWGLESGSYTPPLSGLIYLVGRTLVFEDFEKDDTIMGIPVSTAGKKKKSFEKTTLEISQDDIVGFYPVSHKVAESLLQHKAVFSEKMVFSPRWYNFFVNYVQYIKRDDGRFLILEILNWNRIAPYFN